VNSDDAGPDEDEFKRRIEQARETPGAIAAEFLERVKKTSPVVIDSDDPVLRRLQRIHQLLMEALRELPRKPRAILLLIVGGTWWLRRAIPRARSRSSLATAALDNAMAVAGHLLAAATLAGTLLVGSVVAAPTYTALVRNESLAGKRVLAPPLRDLQPLNQVGLQGARISPEPTLAADVAIPGATHPTSASTHATHDGHKVAIGADLEGWAPPIAGQVGSGTLVWIDCEPYQTLSDAACAALEATLGLISPPPSRTP